MSDTEGIGRLTPYVRRVLIALSLAATIVVLLFVLWRIGDALLVIFASCLFAIFLSGCGSWISRRTVTPMVQHRVIRLPPAAILSIQLLMGYAFGFIGIAVAAPLLAALMVLIEMLYVQDILGDRNIRVTGQEARLWENATPPEARADE